MIERTFDPKLNWISSKDNLIDDFYKPCLSNCEKYQRLSGYFSSTSFANVVYEILEFIEKKGKIELITSPNLSQIDKKIFEQSVQDAENLLSNIFFKDLKNDPENLKIHFAKLMAYMLTNKIEGTSQLEIKIAIPDEGPGLYHQKIGILHYRNGEKISFSGSVNETASGWGENIENFKVFCSWNDETHVNAISHDQRTFNDLWSNNEEEISVYDLPNAVKEHLLKIRPKSTEEFEEILSKVQKIVRKSKNKTRLELFQYQKDARTAWINNNFQGMFAMATGTGKTFASFGCIHEIQKSNDRTVTVIACPQKHLVEQWSEEIKSYSLDVGNDEKIRITSHVTCHSDYANWRRQFEKILNDFNIPLLGTKNYITNHFVIFTTHDTLGSKDFKEKILKIKNAKKFLIVDEVHNITFKSSSNTLLSDYDFRLGLSATPLRHYDPEGTQIISDYFKGVVFTLDLEEAVKRNILCPYDYIPYYIPLNPDEMDQYRNLTVQIARKIDRKQKHTQEKDDSRPELRRADLVANAENKYDVLKEILDLLGNQLNQTLIYCTNNPSPALPLNSPRQLERVKQILSNRHIISDSITWEDPTKDRIKILNNLTNEHFDCVTAVKCLDEGVDIPSVKIGIFMASSGNPKQYIQRRGRVLRKSEKTGKTHATIYDIIVTPPIPDLGSEISRNERKLIAKELLRHKEFAGIARNREDAINKIREASSTFNIDLDILDEDYCNNID